jgi:formate hydrogenlyase subunit 3/multisubunit Na+/H+ antiporter MnhD subunit
MSKLTHPVSAPPTSDGGSGNARVAGGARDRRAGAVRLLGLKRALFAGATAFLSINLWTGAPLFSLWVGSQAAEEQALSMSAVLVVVVVLAVLTLAMSVALLWLEGRYRRLVGHPLRENRLTWLRSFNAQREQVRRVPMSMVEHIVTVTVYVAVIALIVWFLLFAGSPLPHG